MRPRDQLHDINGRLFQAQMWRRYAATWEGRPYDLITALWCQVVPGWTYDGCMRRARVNLYLARRLNRRGVRRLP